MSSADQLEIGAAKYWELFYKRNGNRFFSDRHYLQKEFPDLTRGPLTLLEVKLTASWWAVAGPACLLRGGFLDPLTNKYS